MKVFYDYEFHERFVTTGVFKKHSTHTIEPIELGMIDEEGSSFKVIYNDFDTKAAWNNEWLRKNVIKKYYDDCNEKSLKIGISSTFNYNWFKEFVKLNGKSRLEVQTLIREFIFGYYNNKYNDGMSFSDVAIQYGLKEEPIELWSWFSAYDHVAFCNTFGNMMKLPEGFPMFTNDIEQEFQRKLNDIWKVVKRKKGNYRLRGNYSLEGITSFEQLKNAIQELSDFPVNKNEHDIMSDVQYHKDLYYFIKKL